MPSWAPASSPETAIVTDGAEQAASGSEEDDTEAASAVAVPDWLAAAAGEEVRWCGLARVDALERRIDSAFVYPNILGLLEVECVNP